MLSLTFSPLFPTLLNFYLVVVGALEVFEGGKQSAFPNLRCSKVVISHQSDQLGGSVLI